MGCAAFPAIDSFELLAIVNVATFGDPYRNERLVGRDACHSRRRKEMATSGSVDPYALRWSLKPLVGVSGLSKAASSSIWLRSREQSRLPHAWLLLPCVGQAQGRREEASLLPQLALSLLCRQMFSCTTSPDAPSQLLH